MFKNENVPKFVLSHELVRRDCCDNLTLPRKRMPQQIEKNIDIRYLYEFVLWEVMLDI